MPGNLMLIPDGRSIFIAIRADLQNRLNVRVLIRAWYEIAKETFHKRWRRLRDLAGVSSSDEELE